MAALSDILTSAQNVVQAINSLAAAYLNVQGQQTAAGIAAATLVKPAPGRVASVSVTTAGAVGAIYDANVASATTRLLYVIPATVGVFVVNLPTSYGIVVTPGAAQVCSVSWS